MANGTPDVSAVFGAIEAGGTKFVCAVGTGPQDLVTNTIPTTTPDATIAAATAWLRSCAGPRLASVGIASFGPVDLDPASATWGHITTTPKPGWHNFDFAGSVHRALNVPVAFQTDVNAAVLAESEWGAALDVASALYLTVGTGIGGGALLDGRLLQGHSHPEMGHIRIQRHPADNFPGVCPFHQDCLEGLASGPAIAARGPRPDLHLEAHYLAQALATFACIFSPRRIILGGGVMRQSQLFPLIRVELDRLLAAYISTPDVVPPALGEHSGVLGALLLARQVIMRKTS